MSSTFVEFFLAATIRVWGVAVTSVVVEHMIPIKPKPEGEGEEFVDGFRASGVQALEFVE